MSDIRNMIRNGNVKMAPGAKLKVDGQSIRVEDGTRPTTPPAATRRAKRRAANKQAKASRKVNR